MSKTVGYVVKVFVKRADIHDEGDDWEIAPINDSGEYVFDTEDKARQYAESVCAGGRLWKIVKAVDVDDGN